MCVGFSCLYGRGIDECGQGDRDGGDTTTLPACVQRERQRAGVSRADSRLKECRRFFLEIIAKSLTSAFPVKLACDSSCPSSVSLFFSEISKMFVGGLSWQTEKGKKSVKFLGRVAQRSLTRWWISLADQLQEYFEKFGELAECIVMKDPVTKRSRWTADWKQFFSSFLFGVNLSD